MSLPRRGCAAGRHVLNVKYSTGPPLERNRDAALHVSCSAAGTISSTERLWPQNDVAAAACRIGLMMLMAAIIGRRKREAAVTKRILFLALCLRWCGRGTLIGLAASSSCSASPDLVLREGEGLLTLT